MKPHGRDCPDRCSRCLEAAGRLGAPVKRVDQAGPDLTIDGQAVRPIAKTQETPGTIQSRRRGGLRRKRKP